MSAAPARRRVAGATANAAAPACNSFRRSIAAAERIVPIIAAPPSLAAVTRIDGGRRAMPRSTQGMITASRRMKSRGQQCAAGVGRQQREAQNPTHIALRVILHVADLADRRVDSFHRASAATATRVPAPLSACLRTAASRWEDSAAIWCDDALAVEWGWRKE